MLATTPASASFEVVLADEEATARLAAELAPHLRPGDTIALSGDLGAGKSTFARALIRALARDPALEVPSPTFMLLQSYDLPAFPVVHMDLYRLQSAEELTELDWPELADGALTLIEWPDRAGGLLPAERIEIALALAPEIGPDARLVRVTAPSALALQVPALFTINRFLQDSSFGRTRRVPMQGDASSRAYERLVAPERSAILMIAPRRPDGPPVRNGRPYSAIAHLAEDVRPFVALARGLRERGLSAPEIYAADMAEGLLILEDLGSEPVVAGDPPTAIEERYAVAVDALVALHRNPVPDTLPLAPRVDYQIPRFDMDAMLIEAELLLDWYFPQQRRHVPDHVRQGFTAAWRDTLKAALAAPATWILRDYHSPNLLWLPEREGAARIGVLDFQDAVMGPAAYDVVSLLQDARVDVPERVEDALVRRYLKARKAADRGFDLGEFIALYSIMGAQRASKVLGIFARLEKRDGKPQYLRHQPRVWRNLRRCLAHPALAPLKAWYDGNVPGPGTG